MSAPDEPEESAGATSQERGVIPLFQEIYSIWISERPNQFAAAMAYYAIFSFVPIIYVAVTVAGIFIDELALVERMVEQVGASLGLEAAVQLEQALVAAATRTSGGTPLTAIIGFLAMLFAASLMFSQLQHALNTIWDVPPASRGETLSYVLSRLMGFVMVLGVGLLFIVATAANVLVTALASVIGLPGTLLLANVATVVVLATLALAVLFKVLPNARVAWRDVLIGSALTALLMTLGGLLLGLYLDASRVGSALEAAGAMAVFLIAFYFFGNLFVFGAVFIRVYSDLYGSGIQPEG